MNRLLWTCAALIGLAILSTQAPAATLLLDNFDDGDLATNTGLGGVGSGFTSVPGYIGGGSASESGGTAIVTANGDITNSIQSNDTFDPTGLTLTWGINNATPGGFNGVGVGWAKPGNIPGTPNTVQLEIRADRLTFDLLDATYFTRQVSIPFGTNDVGAVYNWDFISPLVATMTLNANDWSLSITGSGVAINQSGLYTSFGYGGSHIGSPTSVTLGSILADAGEDLAVQVNVFREPGNSAFDYVTVTAVPEPSSIVLLGMSVLGMVRLRRARKV